MKITMYELLGLVKDGKAPKKIKFRNEIYEYINNIEDSIINYVGIEKETSERFYLSSHIGNNYISNIFTDEVEIIEEEPKKIEKWGECALEEMENCTDYTLEDLQEYIRILAETQNELIDEINNLKEK